MREGIHRRDEGITSQGSQISGCRCVEGNPSLSRCLAFSHSTADREADINFASREGRESAGEDAVDRDSMCEMRGGEEAFKMRPIFCFQ